MLTRRREFLERIALGGLGAAALGALDVVSIEAQGPAARLWDLTWVKRLNGKHRAIFDIPAIEDGYGVWRAVLWRKQYAAVFGLQEAQMNTVLNIRHDGIALVLNQDFWREYDLASQWAVKDPVTRRATMRNPILDRTGPNALPPEYEDFTLEKVMAGGAIVLACSMALRDCAEVVSQRDRVSKAEADKKVRAMIHPGVILQPSGIFSAVLAQEHGCAYVRAS